MAARIPTVGEQGWIFHGRRVHILAVYDHHAWVMPVDDTGWGSIQSVVDLEPPEPIVTHYCYLKLRRDEPDLLGTSLRSEAEAKVERLSDGTWRVTPIATGSNT